MSNNERILKEEHILEYQAAFNQFDHKNTGLVATKDLGNVLRLKSGVLIVSSCLAGC